MDTNAVCAVCAEAGIDAVHVAGAPVPEAHLRLVRGVTYPVVEHVVEPIRDHIVSPVAGVVGHVLGAADRAWSGPNAGRARRLRRLGRTPLANLYEQCPEARLATPHELGLRFVPLEDIRGTAVAGAAQRGGDFLPLKPFRGDNWRSRWERIQAANERLRALPPVDLVKYDGAYWVVDGHNRVASAMYAGGAGLDAMVTELVPLGGQVSERPTSLLSFLGEAREGRTAGQGFRPALGAGYSTRHAIGDRRIADQERSDALAAEPANGSANEPERAGPTDPTAADGGG